MQFGVALGAGFLIGLERERNKGDGPQRSPAGIRTFTLAALAGAVSFQFHVLVLAVTLAAIAGWLAIAYWRQSTDDPGLTTEVALLLTPLLGALATLQPTLAAALAVATTILLAMRGPMHHFVRGVLTQAEITSLLTLAAASLVILPILPNVGLGPFQAINPYKIWSIVIVIMAIGGLGHILLRLMGSRVGLPLVGLVSGFVSSTATIGALGARARQQPAQRHPAVAGAVLSTVATLLQMIVILAVVHGPTLRAIWPALALGTVAALAYGALFTWRSWALANDTPLPGGAAFQARTALALGLVLAVLQWVVAATQHWLGDAAIVVVNALAGFADTHAPAMAVATLAATDRLSATQTVLPILAAFSTNTVSKAVVAGFAGGRRYALDIIPGLLAVLLAVWAGWWLLPAAPS